MARWLVLRRDEVIRAGAADAAPRTYALAPERIGWALALAGAAGGALALAPTVAGGIFDIGASATAFVAGAGVTMLIAVVLGAPCWLAAHRLGARGPGAAAAIGFLVGFLPLLFAQTGFALDRDPAVARYRWLSAGMTSVLFGFFAAGVALAAWRVAYRRVWPEIELADG